MRQIPTRLLTLTVLAALLIAAACNGGDDDDTEVTGETGSATPTTLEAQLAGILLQDDEIPEGLQGSGLAFSTNEDLAGPSQEELARLTALGRQLGVDLTFIPTEQLPENVPVRGGIQNSASLYTNPNGASESYRLTEQEARTTDWKTLYDDLTDINVNEVDITVGDESYWFRITGFDECTIEPVGSSTPNPALPSPTCPPAKLVVDDYILFRSGRVRSLVKVLSAHPGDSPPDIYQEQVLEWANIVVQRALETFPVTSSPAP